MAARTKLLIAVAFLGLIQSLARVGISYQGMFGGVQVLPGVADYLVQLSGYLNLVLGLVGLLAIPGLLLLRSWGFWGTVGVCVVSMAFDLWALAAVAPSAALGLIVPALMLVYIVPARSRISGIGGR